MLKALSDDIIVPPTNWGLVNDAMWRTGEQEVSGSVVQVVQWLRALTGLSEVLGSVRSTYMLAHKHL